MLFALGEPAAFAGLLAAFLLALLLRGFVRRLLLRRAAPGDRGPLLNPRDDADPFGAVAAAVGGAGWGRPLSVDEVPRHAGRGRAAAVFAAGPLAVLVAAQLALLAHALLFPDSPAGEVLRPSDVLRGQFSTGPAEQALLGLAGGLLGFGLLALFPVPPLDGFGLLWAAQRRPGAGMQGYRLWFEDKNLGVVILLACCFLPFDYPLLLLPLDLLGVVFLRLWG